MKRVAFFIAGPVATAPEAAALATLLQQTENYQVLVRSAASNANYDPNLEQFDFKAGTSVPSAYASLPTYTPGAALPATQAIVSNGVDLTVPVTGTYATKIHATVANGAITGFVLS